MTTDQLTSHGRRLRPVDAEPYAWPYDGSFSAGHDRDHQHRLAAGLLRSRAATSTRWATTWT